MLSIAAQELAVAPVNQSLFLLKAVLEGHRPDGRFLLDSRKVCITSYLFFIISDVLCFRFSPLVDLTCFRAF